MNSLIKFFMYFIVFILSILILIPKVGIYNLLENELEKKEIIISNEIRDEKLFSLDIKDSKLYYKGIEVSNTSESSIFSLLVYSKIKIKDVKLLDTFTNMIPSQISNIQIEHSILKYDILDIKADGLFGNLVGEIDILKRIVKIELNASQTMKNSHYKILKSMKFKDGRYVYEYRF